jgi:FkbM family methyltransferase
MTFTISKTVRNGYRILRRDGVLVFVMMVTAFIATGTWKFLFGPLEEARRLRYERTALERAKIVNGKVELRIHGQRMNVLANDPGISRDLIVYGKRETAAVKVLSELLVGNMTIIEVGANLGYYVLLEAAKISAKSRIYAFEPSPQNFSILQTNVELNGLTNNVVLHQMAISSFDGTANLGLEKNSNWHHLDPIDDDHFRPERWIEVPVCSVDSFCEKNGIHEINLLRLDVEGHEYAVIEGAKGILEKSKQCIIFLELHIGVIERLKQDPFQILRLLEKSGFRCYCITGVGRTVYGAGRGIHDQGRTIYNVDWRTLTRRFYFFNWYYGSHFFFIKG